jgi:hypothetical protein
LSRARRSHSKRDEEPGEEANTRQRISKGRGIYQNRSIQKNIREKSPKRGNNQECAVILELNLAHLGKEGMRGAAILSAEAKTVKERTF